MTAKGIGATTSIAIPPWEQVRQACSVSSLGKQLPDAFYIHICALDYLNYLLQQVVNTAQVSVNKHLGETIVSVNPQIIVKFILSDPKISFLSYPQFETDPHPALAFSVQINLGNGTIQRRNYSSINPPILHRKETFISPNNPQFQTFSHLTQQEEKLGLLKQSRHIGTRLNWQKRLQEMGLEIHDHALACSLNDNQKSLQVSQKLSIKPQIDRHKAAIHRNALSKPVRLAIEAGLLSSNMLFFDYGCGHGGDVERLQKVGYIAEGWDPYYQPDQPWLEADMVNVGYILNVIEDPIERREALINAWQLTRKILIVAAQVLVEDINQGWLTYGDGVITQRNTFQKYYEQEELKGYIDQILGVDAVPIALGIYLVFRDVGQLELFRASRFRSRASTPRVRSTINSFNEYRSLLQPLMDFYSDRGRLPTSQETHDREDFQTILQKFPTFKQAFNQVLKATNSSEWDAIRDQRRQDWLVYLALAQFGKRPQLSHFDAVSQGDIKGLFGNYKEACIAADLMLINVGNLEIIKESCQRSLIGLQSHDSLWVHLNILESLEPLIRLYEGCGARTFGRPEEAVIVRIHWKQAAITYYTPLNFDDDPHPVLANAMKIDLRSARVFYQDYDLQDNPPILVRKDQLIATNYPFYDKFAKLSLQEVQWGILDSLDSPIKWWTKQAWEEKIWERGAVLKGHRLVWRKDLDPYRRKLLKSEQRRSKL